ncbi:MAG: hypothetical protein KC416_04665 [Myxococcales bacterium]|nr:hypothetical protein [Myxococcales bacterium]
MDSRGSTGASHLLVLCAVALGGIGAFSALGGGFSESIAGRVEPVSAAVALSGQAAEGDSSDLSRLSEEDLFAALEDSLETQATATDEGTREAGASREQAVRTEIASRWFAGASNDQLAEDRARLEETLSTDPEIVACLSASPPTCSEDVMEMVALVEWIAFEQHQRVSRGAAMVDRTARGPGAAEPGAAGIELAPLGEPVDPRDPVDRPELGGPVPAAQGDGGGFGVGAWNFAIGVGKFFRDAVQTGFTVAKWVTWDTWHGANIAGDLGRFAKGVVSLPITLPRALIHTGSVCLDSKYGAADRGQACGRLTTEVVALAFGLRSGVKGVRAWRAGRSGTVVGSDGGALATVADGPLALGPGAPVRALGPGPTAIPLGPGAPVRALGPGGSASSLSRVNGAIPLGAGAPVRALGPGTPGGALELVSAPARPGPSATLLADSAPAVSSWSARALAKLQGKADARVAAGQYQFLQRFSETVDRVGPRTPLYGPRGEVLRSVRAPSTVRTLEALDRAKGAALDRLREASSRAFP